MRQIKPFQTRPFAASGSFDSEFSGRAVRKIGLRISLALTGAAATFRNDAAFRAFKTPEINQSEQPLIRMAGPSWRHLSAITKGGYDAMFTTTTMLVGQCTLDLQKLLPTALINGADKKLFLRGEYGALADLAGTPPATAAGNLYAHTESSELDPTNGFLRPKISEATHALANQDDLKTSAIRFEQDTVVQGVMLRAVNGAAAGLPNSDGLIKALRLFATTRAFGELELHRCTWGQARTITQETANFNQEDYARSSGVVLLPTQTAGNPQYNGAAFFSAGDSLQLALDCAGATVDPEFVGVTPAAGDVVVVTLIAFTPVAGTGDTAAQVSDLSAPARYADPKAERRRRQVLRKRVELRQAGV